MFRPDRRALLLGGSASGLAFALSGCVGDAPTVVASAPAQAAAAVAAQPDQPAAIVGLQPTFAAMYGPVANERFPLPALKPTLIRQGFARKTVPYKTAQPVGTIVVDPHAHYLYLVQPGGMAIRYGVGVGREGFAWKGEAIIKTKQEWPDWYPPKEMIARTPGMAKTLAQLQSGLGVPGGPRNPLGARAMYLWQGNKDTLFRIHGTTEPHSIGTSASSGCIRMINQDAIDLYSRVPEGTHVVVL